MLDSSIVDNLYARIGVPASACQGVCEAMREQPRPSNTLGGIETRPLRQQIADSLIRAILDGEIMPGESLVEMDIAQRLGVSRAPVREAIQIVANTHLVDTAPYRGTTVRRLTGTDVEEVYSLRTVLETYALRRAMALDPVGLAQALHPICDDMQTFAARRDWAALAAEDAHFHEVLIGQAAHGLLLDMWREIYLRVRQIMALRNKQNADSMEIFYRHLPIVEAIEAGDVEAAVLRLEQHIASAADLVVDPVEPIEGHGAGRDEIDEPEGATASASALDARR
jgi:DNA-binding GntR family transcriptional regulator